MPALDITPFVTEVLKELLPLFEDASQKMKSDAEANSPVLTGELKSNFIIRRDSETKLNWVGYERWYARRRVSNTVRYSIFQEAGSKKNRPKRFMRRSFLANSVGVVSKIEDHLVGVVSKINNKVN